MDSHKGTSGRLARSGLAGPSTGADGAAAQRDMAQWLLRHVLRWLARYPASVAAVLRCLQEDRASPRLLQQARPLLRRFLDRTDGVAPGRASHGIKTTIWNRWSLGGSQSQVSVGGVWQAGRWVPRTEEV